MKVRTPQGRVYHVFWPGEPGGYVPHLANDICSETRDDAAIRAAAARGRKKQQAKGITGTIYGIGKRSHRAVATET